MTDENLFDDIGSGRGTVYRPTDLGYSGSLSPQNAPNKARQRFADEHDIEYSACRAKLTKFEGEKVIVVAEIDNDD